MNLRWLWGGGVVLVGAAAFACSTSSNANSSGRTFSGDLPTGPGCSPACNACAQSKCGTQAACLGTQCADFASCFCACDPNASDCQFVCISQQTPDNHCADCVTAANPCLMQQCGSECPNLNPGLSSGTFDSGGAGADSGGGTAVFPFSGPSCPASCAQCIQDNCASVASCYATDCSAFYACGCACAPTDLVCLTSCIQSSACQTCAAGASGCVQQYCSSCAGAALDGGVTLTFSGDSGGDASAWCTQLAACCAVLTDSLNKASCNDSLSLGSALDCESALASFQSAGDCP